MVPKFWILCFEIMVYAVQEKTKYQEALITMHMFKQSLVTENNFGRQDIAINSLENSFTINRNTFVYEEKTQISKCAYIL